jgi:hypothetical protein
MDIRGTLLLVRPLVLPPPPQQQQRHKWQRLTTATVAIAHEKPAHQPRLRQANTEKSTGARTLRSNTV